MIGRTTLDSPPGWFSTLGRATLNFRSGPFPQARSMQPSLESVSAGDIPRVTHGELAGTPSILVNDVTHNSRQIGKGSLFIAVRGELFDAHKFIPQVVDQGAVGVISELEKPSDFAGAWIRVENVRRAMAL